ncbi:hypothetical protein BSKO_06935 [Bryopsis sp. KO-2023]|nr:hypothetical protein BSKO_06935 [Bryopsis sp. KO-2023]
MATGAGPTPSSSEDDMPLVRRTGGKSQQAGKSNGATAPAGGVKRGRAPRPQAKGVEKKRASVRQDVKGENGASTPPRQSSVVKKEEPKNGGVGPMGVKKEETKVESTVGTSNQPVKKPREKKVYDLPGQKREAPPERDSLREFYTTLRVQRPESEMALKWCVEHGLEAEAVALAWVEKNGKTRSVSAGSGRARARGGRGGGRSPGRGAGRSLAEKPEGPASSSRARAAGAPRRGSKKRSAEGALPPKEITKMSKGRKSLKLEGLDYVGNPPMAGAPDVQNDGPKGS